MDPLSNRALIRRLLARGASKTDCTSRHSIPEMTLALRAWHFQSYHRAYLCFHFLVRRLLPYPLRFFPTRICCEVNRMYGASREYGTSGLISHTHSRHLLDTFSLFFWSSYTSPLSSIITTITTIINLINIINVIIIRSSARAQTVIVISSR